MGLCALGLYLRGEYGLGRVDGLVLLAGFSFYLWYSLKDDKAEDDADEAPVETGCYKSMTLCVLAIVFGLGGLVFGGNLFVDAASSIAREWGISEAVIGLTIVAGGTSLPELVSSIMAVIKKKGQMALGNIVGSNIFNLLLILGVSSLIQPLSMGEITFIDWAVMVLSAVMLLIAALSFKKKVLDRADAIILLLIYVVYLVWLIAMS